MSDSSADEPIPAEVVSERTPLAPAPFDTVAPVDTGYTPAGVPTFDSVREKIETRYGTAIGATELTEETPEGQAVEEQYEARQRAAAERVEQIRESMHREKPDES